MPAFVGLSEPVVERTTLQPGFPMCQHWWHTGGTFFSATGEKKPNTGEKNPFTNAPMTSAVGP
jgi:hypothetical protein